LQFSAPDIAATGKIVLNESVDNAAFINRMILLPLIRFPESKKEMLRMKAYFNPKHSAGSLSLH
jgi:hypothetical protein